MRILVIALDVPATPRAPGSPRVFHLLRGLKARGHQVGLVCSVREARRWQEFMQEDGGAELLDAAFPVSLPPALNFWGRVRNLATKRPPFDRRYRSPAFYAAMCGAVRRALDEFPCDVLHVDQLAGGQYVPDTYRGALVMDPHDAISLTETRKLALDRSRGLKRIGWHGLMRYQISKIRNFEMEISARADAYVLNAEPDRAYLERFVPREKLRVIPNGVDTDHYHPAPEIEPQHQLVFTGAYSYAFNTDAMLYFHANILPRVRAQFPQLRVVIVGAEPPAELQELAARDALTTVTGFVSDVRPYLWASALFICPLRGGTGMKNKLLNAMAMGKPIVATPISADGLGVCDGEQMLLAESDGAFADAVARVLNDEALARRLGKQGRAFVEREYGYFKLAARFESLYAEISAKRGAHAA